MTAVSQGLSTTSYALLGLLAFRGTGSTSLTGYELKQRADRTLRFYWVSPAMSQVYTELEKLAARTLVSVTVEPGGRRPVQRYQITTPGLTALKDWLAETEAEFPVLKHPTALRLVMGALIGPERMSQQLQAYLDQLAARRQDLVEVRTSLGHEEALRYPAMVADWGLGYYDAEIRIVGEMLDRLAAFPAPDGSVQPPEAAGGTGSR